MPKKIKLHIEQDISFLTPKKYRSFRNYKWKQERVGMLILIKNRKYEYISHLAKELGHERHTISEWIQKYRVGGIDELVKKQKRTNPRAVMTEEIKIFVKRKLSHKYTRKHKYSELLRITNNKFSLQINYGTFYKYASKIRKNRRLGCRTIVVNGETHLIPNKGLS